VQRATGPSAFLIAEPTDGYLTRPHAASWRKVMEHPHQKMPLKYLEETVRRYNVRGQGKGRRLQKPD
jgi:hypothetical protein